MRLTPVKWSVLLLVLAALGWLAWAASAHRMSGEAARIAAELLRLSPLERPPLAPRDEAAPARPDRAKDRVAKLYRERPRDELVKQAEAAADDARYPGAILNREELEALARLDWARAEPLLSRFAQGGQPRLAARALALLYEHHGVRPGSPRAEELRTKLKALASDRQALASVRDTAIAALLETDWPGRDEWYVVQFEDASLLELKEGYQLYGPLEQAVRREPERLIPLVTRLLGGPNRTVHDMAVSCLVQFNLAEARADALRPLLPWLSDRRWSSARDRLRLIQSLDRLDMKEGVPGLIAVLDEDSDADGEYERAYAGQTLAHFRDARAVPALRRAARSMKLSHNRDLIFKGLLACGGIDPDEAATALEAAARQMSTEPGRRQVHAEEMSTRASLPLDTALGRFLGAQPVLDEAMVSRVVDRAHALSRPAPAVAEELEAIVDRWPSPAADRDFVGRMEQGRLTSKSIALALGKRETMKGNVGPQLRQLAAGKGVPGAVAAIILGDRPAAEEILRQGEPNAKGMLLACASLTSDPLPVAQVGALLRPGGRGWWRRSTAWLRGSPIDIETAAEAYLRAEDSDQARRLLVAARTGQAVITGKRMGWDPGHFSFRKLDELEERLREQVLAKNGPDEVLALLSAGYFGDLGQIIIQVAGARARLIFRPDGARLFERDLLAAELAGLRAVLADIKVEDLGPLDWGMHDGVQMEFLRLSKAQGRRVFMNNPNTSGDDPYAKLFAAFRELQGRPGMTVHTCARPQSGSASSFLADNCWPLPSGE